MARNTAGFSTVEVMVALIVLGVGLLGTLATTALTTRLIGEARTRDRAALIAGARVESERSQAASGCAALTGGNRPLPGRVQEDWSFTGVGTLRQLEVIVSVPTHRGFRSDTVRTVLKCG